MIEVAPTLQQTAISEVCCFGGRCGEATQVVAVPLALEVLEIDINRAPVHRAADVVAVTRRTDIAVGETVWDDQPNFATFDEETQRIDELSRLLLRRSTRAIFNDISCEHFAADGKFHHIEYSRPEPARVQLICGEQEVAVGRDGRVSGPGLQQALIQGLIEAGMQVIDVGMVTTPQLYFAASTACRSGIQVTGSHNPKDHNGFKMVLAGRAIYGEEIQGLRRIIEEDQWHARPGGSLRRLDVQDAYRERITSDIRLTRPMKIVVDSGNGVAGASAPGST